MKKYFLCIMLLGFLSIAIADNSIPEPPTGLDYDAAIDEPEITIRQDKEERVEEYRMNGNLYMIKVSPKNMPSYYLIKENIDGGWVKQDAGSTPHALPMWVIGEF
ncbi:MAG: DUF2782 domain-containing protein [Nitrosomonadales bacterium]|jgi:hypothetical protein